MGPVELAFVTRFLLACWRTPLVALLALFFAAAAPAADNPWKRHSDAAFSRAVSLTLGATDIVQDGQNGLLASTTEEWIEKLSLLVENPTLRRQMGEAGRQTVEDRYSLTTHAPRFLETLQKTAELGRWRRRSKRPVPYSGWITQSASR